jgi:TatD DNase family protein
MNGLVDSHAHLFYESIFRDLDDKLRLAKLAGVDYILTVGTDFKTMLTNVNIAEKYDNIVCSVGVHPHHLNDGYELTKLVELSRKPKVVAIGEVGLDYHYQNETPKNDQITLFKDMLSISKDCELPYIIHARECFEDIFNIMSDYELKPSVFHCYTGSIENAKKILNLGHYISFSGVITFKNSNELKSIVKYVPDDRVLIETDCPYLTPVPHRGKVNEPAFVSLVARCVTNIRNITIEKVAELTTSNFFRLFPKAQCILVK